MSTLYTDDLDVDDEETAGPVLRWEQAAKCKAVYTAIGSTADIWYVMNPSYEQGGDMGRWTLAREPRGGHLTIEGEFDTMQEAIQAGEVMAAEEVS